MGRGTSEIIRDLSRARKQGQTEAVIQSDVRELILSARLSLGETDVVPREVNLEAQTGDGTRRRIDIEVSTTVIEIKKNLSNPVVIPPAENQLGSYVHTRSEQFGAQFYGILTDGHLWRFYVPTGGVVDGELALVSEFINSPSGKPEALLRWLSPILSRVEQVLPTPENIAEVVGAGSPTYLADHMVLKNLYERSMAAGNSEVSLKHELWGKLLKTAFGDQFQQDAGLFVDHTLLVLTAEIIAHAVIGFDISKAGPLMAEDLASGHKFSQAEIYGVVEADFFDWALTIDGGGDFIVSLAHRLSRFDWSDVDHDVLKHVYESVILQETRKDLGEYYTPDWLAECMISEIDYDPLTKRALDASCGSGTFLFHAVRNYLRAAKEKGVANADAIEGVVNHVFGMDIHPVSVTLARVTYLLAIGQERLQQERGAFSIPVYLGDAMQWEQNENLFTEAGQLTVPTSGSNIMSDEEGSLVHDDALIFPLSTMRDTQSFDRVMTGIVDRIDTFQEEVSRGMHSKTMPLLIRDFGNSVNKRVLKPEGITGADADTLVDTSKRIYSLHVSNRDHIWGYYVRNLIRPVWLSMPENRVDVLIGNPPWLRYASMTPWMQKKYIERSKAHNLILGRLGASGRDLSTLFVVRACALYLKNDGQFAYVLPHGVLTRKSSAGFRTGQWGILREIAPARIVCSAAFSKTWDLKGVTTGFPITSGVMFGKLSDGKPQAAPRKALTWTGSFSPPSQPWETASKKIAITNQNLPQVTSDDVPRSPYAKRFRQGAILVPRRLLWAIEQPTGLLGSAGGAKPMKSRISKDDKDPWKTLAPLEAQVSPDFIFEGHLGEHILPYRMKDPEQVILPVGKGHLLTPSEAMSRPGLDAWWRQAERLWEEYRKPDEHLPLSERIDYHQQLSSQLRERDGYIVVYPSSGSKLMSAYFPCTDRTIIDTKCYWTRVTTRAEAQFLTGVLNSQMLLDRVRPLQSVGLLGPRDFHKYVFMVPFKVFDSENVQHLELVDLVTNAEELARNVIIDGVRFQKARTLVRQALEDDGIYGRIEECVSAVLPEIDLTD